MAGTWETLLAAFPKGGPTFWKEKCRNNHLGPGRAVGVCIFL